MTTRAHFPTLIYEATVGRGAAALRLRQDLLDDCAKLREGDDAGRRWSRRHYPGGYTSYGSLDKLHETFSTFRELARQLDRHARAYAKALDMDLGQGRLVMTDCWVNIMPKHTAHGLHLHPLSVISGTFYLKTPPGSSRLRFEDPRLDRFMRAPPKRTDARPENRHQVLYDIAPGKVILFESWLRHEVVANQTARERISVSFNYDWV